MSESMNCSAVSKPSIPDSDEKKGIPSMNDWIELIVHTTTSGSGPVSDLLIQMGASGTQTEDRADIPDPAKPHGIWEIIDPKLLDAMPRDVLVHAWFQADQRIPDLILQISRLLADLKDRDPGCGSLRLESKSIPDENWGESWKLLYHPLRAGQHLVIKPSWEDYSPRPGDHIIEMDPGMAFGSGYHDTTVLCLALLEKYIQPGDRVIDVGTGSGILAIGAALSGAGSVLAVDIDPDAVRVARQNVEHHGLEQKIRVQEGDLLRQVEETCDICAANIIADIILSFAEPLKAHIRPGGLFICSGIILERKDEVLSCLLQSGYEPVEERITEEWAALCVRRKS